MAGGIILAAEPRTALNRKKLASVGTDLIENAGLEVVDVVLGIVAIGRPVAPRVGTLRKSRQTDDSRDESINDEMAALVRPTKSTWLSAWW